MDDCEKNPDNSVSAFEIDDRIGLKIEFELAISLGHLILGTDTTNKALLALGHRLQNLSDKNRVI